MSSRVIAWSTAAIVLVLVGTVGTLMWNKHVQSVRLARSVAKLAALDAGTKRKICAHRCNNLPLYREAARYFDCIEMDIHIDPPGGGPPGIFHPPAEKNNHGLTLDALLRSERLPKGRLWLDVKDLSEKNWAPFLERLLKLIPPQRRRDVIVETVGGDRGVQPAAAAFRSKGFSFSYYLPTDGAIACGAARTPSCDALRRQVQFAVSLGFSHLSFDARAYPFVKAIRGALPGSLRLLTWDLQKSWPRPDLIDEVDVYIVNFPSRYSDPHN